MGRTAWPKSDRIIVRASFWELYAGTTCVECERLGGLRNFYSARRWLEQCKASVNSMLALRDRLSRERSGSWQLDRATDDMIIEYAAHLLSTGFWHVHTSGSATGNGGASQGGAADIK